MSGNKEIPQDVNPSQESSTAPHIHDIQQNPPDNWDDQRVKLLYVAMENSGVLPDMIRRNPSLPDRLSDFLFGDKNILLVGGESGMGKSLISAEIRSLYADLAQVIPTEKLPELVVSTWDRTHQQFYDEVSAAASTTIQLPQGETPLIGRKMVSDVLEYQARFALRHINRNARILIESPLIDTRGETLFDNLAPFNENIQTFIMHSPDSRNKTLEEGRSMDTSGQPDSMNQIRERLLTKILPKDNIPTSHDAQDEVIKKWWIEQMKQYNGVLIEWSPYDNEQGYRNSVEKYEQRDIRPDHVSRQLSYATRNEYESIFRTIRDIDSFLRKIIP